MAFEPRRTTMPRKRHKPEEIVAKLRQVDVLVSQGQSVAEAVRSIGVTEVTYYRWRQEFGGTLIGGRSTISASGATPAPVSEPRAKSLAEPPASPRRLASAAQS